MPAAARCCRWFRPPDQPDAARTPALITILGFLILATFANSFSGGPVLDSHSLVTDRRVHSLSLDN